MLLRIKRWIFSVFKTLDNNDVNKETITFIQRNKLLIVLLIVLIVLAFSLILNDFSSKN